MALQAHYSAADVAIRFHLLNCRRHAGHTERPLVKKCEAPKNWTVHVKVAGRRPSARAAIYLISLTICAHSHNTLLLLLRQQKPQSYLAISR